MPRKPPAGPGELPRSDPEIIPPRQGREDVLWTSTGRRGDYRSHSMQLGPFTLALLLIGIALLVAFVIILAIGTFLLWIPIIALLVLVVIISAWWRRLFRRET
jgi:hypothetical protein